MLQNSLLQETSEEWEQYEKKSKDVRSWIEKTKSSLESPQNRKKPLRDQHALREKLVNDCQIQKSKITLSVEKLQLHFRSGIGGDSKIGESAEELCGELDDLSSTIKDQSKQLEISIAQVDQYQLEVQQLRQQIIQVEQQLRSVVTPSQTPQDSEQMLRNQQVGFALYLNDCVLFFFHYVVFVELLLILKKKKKVETLIFNILQRTNTYLNYFFFMYTNFSLR